MAIGRGHEHVHPTERRVIGFRQRPVIAQVCDTNAVHLEDEDRVDLAEFHAVGVGVLALDAVDHDVAYFVPPGIAVHGNVIPPRERVSPALPRVVIVMRMRDEDGRRCHAVRPIVPQPNSAGVWIDDHPVSGPRLDTKRGVGNVLDCHARIAVHFATVATL